MSRLLEPSTWAGLAAIVSSVAHVLPAALVPGWAVGLATSILGAVAVALRERGNSA